MEQLNEHIEQLKKNITIYNDRDLQDFGPRANQLNNNNKLNSSNFSTKERE